MEPLLSIIVPSYNVSSKIFDCFSSLDALKKHVEDLEVIFADDKSTDDTYDKVLEFSSTRDWVTCFQLPANTGTPSVPRNQALKVAKGKYVFHLDSDDKILADGILAELSLAERTQADVVRAPLLRFDGRSELKMNVIPDWDESMPRIERVRRVVRYHSTTVCGLYRRKFMMDEGLEWPEDLRLAEDAIFLYKALVKANVQYSAEPDFRYNTVKVGTKSSSTQQYQKRELDNHLSAWRRSADILSTIGIDYFGLRGQIALQAAFQNMIRYNQGGFAEEDFRRLSDFLNEFEPQVRAFTYGPRFAQLRDFVLDGKYAEFQEAIKIRLLIAGYDLRFILPAVPELSKYYQVCVDEWTGHDSHDEERSRRLLEWADSIHCEWMLGNAVWYSKNKNPRQSLAVRLHRFETTKDYGNQLDRAAVDKVITIAPGMFEETQSVFGFDREIVTYVPNYIQTSEYMTSSDPAKVFNLVMVGSIPIRKGYRRALELLRQLKEVDPRYSLTVFGRRPDELGWVINDPAEREYFSECERFIERNGLGSAVHFQGWVDTKTELADKGFVLSLSDAEGSHVAAAEGFAASNITLLRPWAGAEYMYPNQYIFDSLADMRDYVLECRDYEVFKARAKEGGDYVEDRYRMERFIELYTSTMPIPHSVP